MFGKPRPIADTISLIGGFLKIRMDLARVLVSRGQTGARPPATCTLFT
jgi:hypothetical protein